MGVRDVTEALRQAQYSFGKGQLPRQVRVAKTFTMMNTLVE